jgi:hypothetical protein
MEKQPKTESTHAGGAAMAGGQRCQARVTAWWAARILLQTPVGAGYDLTAVAIAERIYCETTDSTDDLRVELNDGGRIFGQCKTGLRLSNRANSEWGKVIKQFFGELERVTPLGIERRFVLFYEKNNGTLEKLAAILKRYRDLPVGTAFIDAALSDGDKKLANQLDSLLNTLQAEPGFTNLATKREELLRHTYIEQRRLGENETDLISIKDALQDGLLNNRTQTDQVIKSLHCLADDLLAERGSKDRVALRKRLLGEGVVLKDSVDYRTDFNWLHKYTNDEISAHIEQGRSQLASAIDTIPRLVVNVMQTASEQHSFLVVGEAGSGKSGCMLNIAQQLRAAGRRVWYWSADSLPYASPPEIGMHLRLTHSWGDIFDEAVSGEGATLIVDGLDGLRDTDAQRAYRNLFTLALKHGVRVIASIRLFDLRYSPELQELFRAHCRAIAPDYVHPDLLSTKHILVDKLTLTELAQAVLQYPAIWTILQRAPQLVNILLNCFNLNLLCSLITEGETAEQLSGVSTQAELFDRYWQKRVETVDLREEMKVALRELIEQMVEQRKLQAIPNHWSSDVRTALFSSSLVRCPIAPLGHLPAEELVEFNHHLFFDYVAERLFVRLRKSQLAQELATGDSWGLFLRPSLTLFHRYAWKYGRQDFWNTLIALERGGVRILQKLSGYLVIAEEARSVEDIQPLLDGSLRDDVDRSYWRRALQGTLSVVSALTLPELLKANSGDWWIELAGKLTTTNDPYLLNLGAWLLSEIARYLDLLRSHARLTFNQAAVALVQFGINTNRTATNSDHAVIGWVCQTMDADVASSSAVIRECLTDKELARAGYFHARALAEQVETIAVHNLDLAVEVYERVFGYSEEDETAVPFVDSPIHSMRMGKNDLYESARRELNLKLPALLTAYPQAATRAVVKVVDNYLKCLPPEDESPSLYEILTQSRKRPAPNIAITTEPIFWNGFPCRFKREHNRSWIRRNSGGAAPLALLSKWEAFLTKLPNELGAEKKWETIANTLTDENEIAVVWQTLLSAGETAPAFYSSRLWTLLCNPVILTNNETYEAAEDCLSAFVPHLDEEAIQAIEAAIHNLTSADFPDEEEAYVTPDLPRRKAQLVRYLPEDKRSEAASMLVSQFADQNKSKQERYYATSYATSYDDDDHLTLEGVQSGIDDQSEIAQELIALLAPLNTYSIYNDKENLLNRRLEQIAGIERILNKAEGQLTASLAAVGKIRLVNYYAILACSDESLDSELIESLFDKLSKAFAELPTEKHAAESLSDTASIHLAEGVEARVATAEALACLAGKAPILRSEMVNLLRLMAGDQSTRVRGGLGGKIGRLYNTIV